MALRFTLGKQERLKSRKLTEELFRTGKTFTVFPVRVFYQFDKKTDWKFPVQAGVSASGKNFRRAVDRNRIKRVLREAYRVQKNELYDICLQEQKQLTVFFIYIDKTLPAHPVLSEKMDVILKKLGDIAREKHS